MGNYIKRQSKWFKIPKNQKLGKLEMELMKNVTDIYKLDGVEYITYSDGTTSNEDMPEKPVASRFTGELGGIVFGLKNGGSTIARGTEVRDKYNFISSAFEVQGFVLFYVTSAKIGEYASGLYSWPLTGKSGCNYLHIIQEMV